MPNVLDQPRRPPTQHLARAPLFFRYFNGSPSTYWGETGRRTFRSIAFREGSAGFADGEGKNADAIGIGPVHPKWTVVDGELASRARLPGGLGEGEAEAS